jgi:cell division protein FtsN
VQVAAYQTQQAAQALAEQLQGRGYPVRVFGVAAPFRVRIGRYATEAEADSMARVLKARGQVGFVTAAEPITP